MKNINFVITKAILELISFYTINLNMVVKHRLGCHLKWTNLY